MTSMTARLRYVLRSPTLRPRPRPSVARKFGGRHMIASPEREDGVRRAIGEAHRRFTRMINFREGWRGHLLKLSMVSPRITPCVCFRAYVILRSCSRKPDFLKPSGDSTRPCGSREIKPYFSPNLDMSELKIQLFISRSTTFILFTCRGCS